MLSGWQWLTMHLLSHKKAQFALRKVTPRAA